MIRRKELGSLADSISVILVTALPVEHAAAVSVMRAEPYTISPTTTQKFGFDCNVARVRASSGSYNNVAIIMLPAMGNNLSANNVERAINRLPNLRFAIMCGKAGGLRSQAYKNDSSKDVRLGDVVASGVDGVIQYDKGVDHGDSKLAARPPPRSPAAQLVEAYNTLLSLQEMGSAPWEKYIEEVAAKHFRFRRPQDNMNAIGESIIYSEKNYRKPGRVRLFQSAIASGNMVLRNLERADSLHRLYGALAIDMESSGLADAAWQNNLPYFVIRGLSDFADSSKGDHWEGYSVLAAAAVTRTLLEQLPAISTVKSKVTPRLKTGAPSKQTRQKFAIEETRMFASVEVRDSLRRNHAEMYFAVDDGLALYLRPDFSPISLDEIRILVKLPSSAPIAPRLIDPTQDQLNQLDLSGYSQSITAYLKKRMRKPLPGEYQTKVGLTQIDLPVSSIGKKLCLHVKPLSYWILQNFNRAIIGEEPASRLRILRDESIDKMLAPSQHISFCCPSAFYIEVTLITADNQLIILQKNQSLSILATTSRKWTCTMEEGMVWDKDVENGQLNFNTALFRGLYKELGIQPKDVEKISWHGIALEHTHLNTAILGSVRLRRTAMELSAITQASNDFVGRAEFCHISRAADKIFVRPIHKNGWHPLARMRVLLSLYEGIGRQHILDHFTSVL